MSNYSGYNFIGSVRSAEGNVVLKSKNATTELDLTPSFYQATQSEVDSACQLSASAFPLYNKLPATRRAEFLNKIADELDMLKDDFISLVEQETALDKVRIKGECGRTSNQMRLFAEVLLRGDYYDARIDRAKPDRQPIPRTDIRQCRLGLGPVVVFGASNFPLAFSTAGGDTASALAAGCPVVFKAHSGHMGTAEQVALAILRAAKETSMPEGVFSMVFGSGVGEALVKHPAMKAVGFTGSLHGGKAICDMAAARPHPIPVFAEMSSINPVVLLPQALSERGDTIASQLSDSVVLGVGQFCTNPGVVIGVRSPDFTAFVNKFTAEMSSKPNKTMLNSGALKSYQKGCETLIAHPGVKVLSATQGSDNEATTYLFQGDAGLLLSGDKLLQEEVFGPATVVIEAKDQQELLACIAAMHGQLTATIIGELDELLESTVLISLLEEKAGRVLINGYPTGVEVCDSMVHGGPFPATSDSRGTSVGTLAIDRFLRPHCFQNYPDSLLPDALKNSNPLNIVRLVDGAKTNSAI
jgi:alpha-ketoglutaric semialdehyde dehydrogenase